MTSPHARSLFVRLNELPSDPPPDLEDTDPRRGQVPHGQRVRVEVTAKRVLVGAIFVACVGAILLQGMWGGKALRTGGIYVEKKPLATQELKPGAFEREAYISWAEHPDMCLDVTGGFDHNGNTVQTWKCSNHPDMVFLVPVGRTGPIRWASHPELCLDAPGGHKLILWDCAKGVNKNQKFTVPATGEGPISLASRPDDCVGVNWHKSAGDWIQMWKCEGKVADVGLRVRVRCHWEEWSTWSECSKSCGGGLRSRSREESYRMAGVSTDRETCELEKIGVERCNLQGCGHGLQKEVFISWARHLDRCMDVRDGLVRSGNVPQMWHCHDHPDMRFLVPVGGVGPIRWAPHPDLCLDAPTGGQLQFWNCSTTVNKNMIFEVPLNGSGRIVNRRQALRCLQVRPGDGVQVAEPLEASPCDAEGGDAHFTLVDICKFDAWSEWSSCSSSCGGGHRLRKRNFAVDFDHAGTSCASKKSESGECHSDQCHPPPRKAAIHWGGQQDKCLVVSDGYTSTDNKRLRVGDCHNEEDAAFLVPSELDSRIHWANHPELCVVAPGGPQVMLTNCDIENQDALQFTLPKDGPGHIHMSKYPDACLFVADSTASGEAWLQVWGCTENNPHMTFAVEDM